MELEDFEIAVLKVMHSRKIYGKNHKRMETILKSGFPKHEIKNVKKAIESLLKKGFIIWYHKADKSIQLNKNLYQEIEAIIKNSFTK